MGQLCLLQYWGWQAGECCGSYRKFSGKKGERFENNQNLNLSVNNKGLNTFLS
jgi:hypothetical protein